MMEGESKFLHADPGPPYMLRGGTLPHPHKINGVIFFLLKGTILQGIVVDAQHLEAEAGGSL